MAYDFEGWATKNDILCADGRTIRRNAFQECDNKVVPLVWGHNHRDPGMVLGHALLKNCPEGVYAYGTFNKTPNGKNAKELLKNRDITALSIFADSLKQDDDLNVTHGCIKELSLVLAGANRGATITNVMAHSVDGTYYESDDEAVIFDGEGSRICYDEEDKLMHDDMYDDTYDEEYYEDDEDYSTDENDEYIDDYDADEEDVEDYDYDSDEEPVLSHSDDGETVQDVLDTMSKKQKDVLYYMIGEALNNSKGGEDMAHSNIFEGSAYDGGIAGEVMTANDMQEIFDDAKSTGSLAAAVAAHGFDEVEWNKNAVLAHGITGVGNLFPDPKTYSLPPVMIARDQEWVSKFMGRVHHTPFSRVKSFYANITEDEARARGYIKGKQKKEEVFEALKRSTLPTTIYKLQKMDRDDVIDVTDFDVVSWIKSEMRMMLDEEMARAMLISDGRNASSDDKINEQNIRPIMTDDDVYSVKVAIPVAAGTSESDKAKAFIKGAVRSRKNYKGSGSPMLFTTEDNLTEMLLIEDANGRQIYDTIEKLKNVLRVSDIVTVPVMENVTGPQNGTLAGIIVNPVDYNVGADKGGAVSMFDDFDINYNKQAYLIETRCSGALIKPYSALVLEYTTAA